LRHLALGAIRAAQRHCHGDSIDLRLYAETVADRSNVTARYRATEAKSDSIPEIEPFPPRSARPAEPVRERRPSRSMRVITAPRLSEEVERILSSAPAAPPIAPARTPSGSRFLAGREDETRISSVPPPANRDSVIPAEGEDGGGKTPSSSRTG
jgi:hypothetical protein